MAAKNPFLIIVLGPPASGKTTLAAHLSKEIRLPSFGKDQIKEMIFDTLGWSDQEWNARVTDAGYAILYFFLDLFLSKGHSLIVESNFQKGLDEKKFIELQRRYNFQVIQIVCNAKWDILYERYSKRAVSGKRHPGHTDQKNYKNFKYEQASKETMPLPLRGPVIEFDSTDIENADYSELFRQVKSQLRNPKSTLRVRSFTPVQKSDIKYSWKEPNPE